jgi:TolB-like protein/class 3 adenylate cyclase/tetratricopeptide (TPR) repeat protein
MAEQIQRKLAAILAADIAGYSRLAGADEERTLARLRALRSDLIDPLIQVHHGRVVKRAVDAVRCAIEVQAGMAERNAGLPPEQRIDFRIGIHVGDVVEENDGDLMGDAVNIAARLEGEAAPGGISLSEDAWRQVRDRVKEHFIDRGEKALKHIARKVRVFSVELEGPAATRRQDGAATAAGAAAPPPHLSIVVLPFANFGGDPEQEYFVDGITESLTTDLSRIAGSFVIARNTAFTYKGKPIDVKAIGRDLNVRYVLEGSVQRGGSRMRVNVQLVDAETGNHLWAERFDKPLTDLFDMQDEIVGRLAGTLNSELIAAEARRAERSPRPDSMDLHFQGLAAAAKGWAPEYAAQARGFFERALALDPGNIEALVGTATVDMMGGFIFTADDRTSRFSAAESTLTRVLKVAPNHAWAHYLLGFVLIHTARIAQGIAECERALALDPNLAMAQWAIGQAKYFAGRGEETEAHLNEALRLSPRDTNAHIWLMGAGFAKLQLRADEDAAARFRGSIERNRNLPIAHFGLAAALSHLGRTEEAKAAAASGLALDPTFTIARMRAGAVTDNPAYLAGREHIYDGMRKAGVPEG